MDVRAVAHDVELIVLGLEDCGGRVPAQLSNARFVIEK